MTQVFTDDGSMVGVTLVEIEPVCLLEKVDYSTKTVARIGVNKVPENRVAKVKKPVAGYFKKLEIAPYKIIKEVPIEKDAELAPKSEFGVDLFKEGEIVHVRAKAKGRGFQGGMKRHGWSGQPASHGSMTHRRIGSAGSNSDPARTFRGLRMPGHMGDKPLTVRNLKIVKIDAEKQLLFLKGSVPGARGSFVNIKKA